MFFVASFVAGHLSVQGVWTWIGTPVSHRGLPLKLIASSVARFWSEMAGDANRAGAWKIFKSIIFSPGADWAMTRLRIS